MKYVVVTGATSFIGIHLIKKLLQNNYKVYAVVRPNSKNIARLPKHSNMVMLEVELSNTKDILNYISGDIYAFYHLAWEGARVPYRDDKVMQEKNYQAAIDAFEVALSLNVKKFIGIGSQAEYGKFNGVVDESYPCNPLTEYGKSKYATYLTILKLASEKNIKFYWPRIFSAYGPYDYEKSLIMSCIDKMQKNESIDMTECTQNWDYIYIDDIVEALIKFLDNDCENGAYNLASGNSRQLKLFVEEIKDVLQSKSIINYGAIPYGKEGPISFRPNVNKLEKALNWTAATKFTEGIKQIL